MGDGVSCFMLLAGETFCSALQFPAGWSRAAVQRSGS